MSIKVTTVVTGIRNFGYVRRTLDEQTRIRLRAAVQETTLAVEARAKSLVPVSGPASRKAKNRPGPGELRDTIRSTFALSGMAGYVMAGFGNLKRRAGRRSKYGPRMTVLRRGAFERRQKKLAKQKALGELNAMGVYAMVVNYGSPGRGIAAAHYMDRARDAERAAHVGRITAALREATRAAQTVQVAA